MGTTVGDKPALIQSGSKAKARQARPRAWRKKKEEEEEEEEEGEGEMRRVRWRQGPKSIFSHNTTPRIRHRSNEDFDTSWSFEANSSYALFFYYRR